MLLIGKNNKEIAKEFNIRYQTVISKVKKYTGLTPTQYKIKYENRT